VVKLHLRFGLFWGVGGWVVIVVRDLSVTYSAVLHSAPHWCTSFLFSPSGWFYDWTQEYDTAFYFSGFCVLLGGFLLLLAALPCWKACTEQSSKLPANTYSYKVAS